MYMYMCKCIYVHEFWLGACIHVQQSVTCIQDMLDMYILFNIAFFGMIKLKIILLYTQLTCVVKTILPLRKGGTMLWTSR